MFRATIILWSLMMAITASGQEAKDTPAPYKVPGPQGWGKETIPLPPDFALEMTWRGTEELRFAPNWAKADSSTFFSYAMFYWLPKSPKISAKSLEREFLVYYRGLAKAVSSGKNQVVDVKTFTMTVKEATPKSAKRASGEDVTAFVGELNWIEPFTTGKPQNLHLEIQVWRTGKQKSRCVFICASPQPQTSEVWKSLREIREGCVLSGAPSDYGRVDP